MLADFDYFFAQCEEKRNPSLKDKPVIVCVYSGRTEDSGAVSTANYLARSYGVRSGMPIAVAKKRLENMDAVFLPVDHEFYEAVSGRIMNILRGFADAFEQGGVDEAYLDASKRVEGDFDRAKALVQDMKTAVKVQEGVTFSVGVGPNKLVAKMASDMQKPDGLTIVKPDEVESFLAPLPVDRLLGVGQKTMEKMQTLNIRTISDLVHFDAQKLIEVFGKRLGAYFHNAAVGIDDDPVQERGEAESIGRIATLKEDTRDLLAILEKVNALCVDIAAGVAQRHVSYSSVGIMAVMTDMTVRSRSKTLESPSDDLATLQTAVKELYEKLLSEIDVKVRRAGVKVAGFVEDVKKQKALTDFV